MRDDLIAIRRQYDVFLALLYRELVARFQRRQLGFLEELGSIVVHVAVFSALKLMMGGGNHYGMQILPFITTGVFTYWLIRSGIGVCSQSPLTLRRYRAFPQVTLLDVAIARGVVNMAIYIAIAFIIFAFEEAIGFSGPIGDPLAVLGLLVTTGILGIGMGLVLMGLFHYAEAARTMLLAGFTRTLSFVGGTFFVYPDLPYSFRPYAEWIPMIHINDMLREAYFPTYRVEWASASYVAWWVCGTMVFGLIVERAIRREVTG